MHDPIQLALNQVYFEVPHAILEATFTPILRRITLDRCIMYDVINSVVLPTLNLGGGKLAHIPLLYQNIELLDAASVYGGIAGSYAIYRILPHARENRTISSVHYLRPPGVYSGTSMAGIPIQGGLSVGDLTCQVLNSHTMSGAYSTPTPVLLTGDTIRIEPPITGFDWVLVCKLAYDENFTNMDVNIIPTFVKIVVAAVKAFIYNKMIIQMDTTYLAGGQELGTFKQIVESYSDQFQVFNELIPHFNVISVLEPERIQRVLKYMI